MGAKQMGMGYASSNLSDEWCNFNNVGGLGRLQHRNVAVAYEVTPLLIGGNRLAAVFNNPFKFGTASVGIFRFGDNVYSEQLFSVGLGNLIGSTSLGGKLNVVQYNASGFGTRTAVTLDFGGITQITKEISIGAYITNLTQSTFAGADNYRLPTRLTLGVGLRLKEQVFITSEIEKDLDYKPNWRTGLEYEILKNFFLRTGFNFNPENIYVGLGGKRSTISFDYAVRFNQLVGTSHQIAVAYNLLKAEK
jgi:hypothetical protein